MTDDGEWFGARLLACRQSAGLSQQELAERSGVSVRAISNLERGRSRWPYRDTLQRLADALELRDAVRAGFIAAAGRRLAATAGSAGGDGWRADGGRLVPRQLPVPVRGFTGRESELSALTGLLGQAQTATPAVLPISVIWGTAGVGKTALVVQWAHQVCAEFPDGQWFVDLRGFDPSGLPVQAATAVRRFLDALSVPSARIPADLDAQVGLYRSLLAGTRMLVVLDNARDPEQVRPLLPGAPGCLVLVTSRNQLPDLIALDGAVPLTVDLLAEGEARELLCRRLGPLRVTSEQEAADELISLCARLPLALNVAASRAATHPGEPLGSLVAGLRDRQRRLDLLSVGKGAANLREVFFWSYQTLGGPAARMFRLLGVHPGPEISVAAAASLAAADGDQARRVLGELTAAHLLTEHVPGRYSLHDLLRAYAAEHARADGGAARATHRILDHYLHTARAATLVLFPARDLAALPAPQPGSGR